MDWDAVRPLPGASALNPEHPTVRNTVQNPDIFFQHREACNGAYDAPARHRGGIHEGQISDLTGARLPAVQLLRRAGRRARHRRHGQRLRHAAEEVVDYLNAQGEKVGLIQVHLYRPFSVHAPAWPTHAGDRADASPCWTAPKEPGAIGEPLYEDVCAALTASRAQRSQGAAPAATASAPRTPPPPR